jgi:hypothetical protein
VRRTGKGVTQIVFEDRDGMPSRRVESLKRVFRLHERWPDELRHQIDVLRDEVADIGRRRRQDTGQNLTEQQLQDILRNMLQQKRDKYGRRANYILQASYLTFALQNTDELEGLFREVAA